MGDTLDDIAERIGTLRDEQESDDHDREYSGDDESLDQRDVQDEYAGGWATER